MLYFDGDDIGTPLVVLLLYAFAGTVVIAWSGRIRPARKDTGAQGDRTGAAAPEGSAAKAPTRGRGVVGIFVALGVCAVMQCLFSRRPT